MRAASLVPSLSGISRCSMTRTERGNSVLIKTFAPLDNFPAERKLGEAGICRQAGRPPLSDGSPGSVRHRDSIAGPRTGRTCHNHVPRERGEALRPLASEYSLQTL